MASETALSSDRSRGPAGLIRGLDGLRAVAILLVILWHAAKRLPPEALGVAARFADAGWTGVDLFFALSGFLITSLLLEEEARSGRGFSLRDFYARRALRILPPFYLVLLLNTLLVGVRPFSDVVGTRVGGSLELVSLATYWSNYFFTYFESLNPARALLIYWSLCVEEHFYLLWPLCLFFVRGRRPRMVLALGACLAFLLMRLFGRSTAFEVQTLSHFRMDSILWGALAALGFEELRARREALRLVAGLLVALVATMFLTGFLSARPGRTEHAIGLTLLAVSFAALVSEVAANPESRLTRALDVRPLRALGRVSYGMYLLHMQAISVAALLLPRGPSLASYLLLVVSSTACTWAASFLMYRFYEKRFLALKRHFRRLEPASS